MEVHHHSHTPGSDSHRSKKKWTHYFWEFLMLFLAVFCGFLAENQREHMVEHQREKKYMRSMLIDLAGDTVRYNRGLPLKEQRINAIDTVFMFFNANPGATTISGKLFRTIRRTSWDQNLTRNTITINQLKNAGGMRLIRNKEVVDSITSYDLQCTHYTALYGEYYIDHQQLGFRNIEKLVNAKELLPLYISNNASGVVANIPDSITVHINTSGLNEYLNFLMQVKVFARQEIDFFERLKQTASALIGLIKKEYQID